MLSIVIPIYNAEKYLAPCLDSILGQSFHDFELLLINDGSTDNSGAICDKYAVLDSRIRIFVQENKGVSAARNKGVTNAKGEWLYFMDADDTLKPEGLQLMMNYTNGNIDMVWAGYEIFDEQQNKILSANEETTKTLSVVDALRNMYRPDYYPYQGYLWCKMFRRELIKQASIQFNERIYFNEDRLFITEAICASRKEIIMTTLPVYNYYEHAASAMQTLMQRYNPKFETDLLAFLIMQDTIKNHTQDAFIHCLAEQGVFGSYHHIIGMQKHYGIQTFASWKRVTFPMLQSIGWKKYCKYEIMRYLHKIKRQIVKIIKCVIAS